MMDRKKHLPELQSFCAVRAQNWGEKKNKRKNTESVFTLNVSKTYMLKSEKKKTQVNQRSMKLWFQFKAGTMDSKKYIKNISGTYLLPDFMYFWYGTFSQSCCI